MFERFTDRARRVVMLAQEESRALNHDHIRTEHILLGLLAEGGGVAYRVLEGLGVDAAGLRSDIESRVERGSEPRGKHIPFTPRAKKVLELSLKEALGLGHNYIGTEHILLGLARGRLIGDGEGLAATVLRERGLTYEVLRERVVGILAIVEGQEAVGGGKVPKKVRRDRVDLAPRARTKPGVALCGACDSPLGDAAGYQIVDAPEAGGDGTARVLFLFCRECGAVIDDVILPDA